MLTYFDRASMACSLEVRVPFLDHEFVELAATIPTQHKVRGLTGKHVLRLASQGHIPESVLKKRKRGFFNEAVGTWVGADGGALVDRLLLADDPAYAAVIDPATVRRAVAEWRASGRHTNLLLALVMLELWLSEYLPRALSSVPAPAAV
jgi:asparagine synthase (glutamine-hydrolysing)